MSHDLHDEYGVCITASEYLRRERVLTRQRRYRPMRVTPKQIADQIKKLEADADRRRKRA